LISKETVVQIKSLSREGWKIGSIAKELGIHPTTVQRHLDKSVSKEPSDESAKASLLDPWISLLETTLEKHPTVRATRLQSMLRERGYKGSIYPIRRFCRKNRSGRQRAFLDLSFTPGEMAQVDWADFGRISIGKYHRKLNLFLMVLAYSRRIFGYFFHDMCSARVLEGHTRAFSLFGGCTRLVLYDNMKTAVIEHFGDGVRFNSDLLELASHYSFIPRACNPRSGWEKGRVERAVRYVRENFFEARNFDNLEDLNQQLAVWLNTEAMDRKWPDDHLLTVRDAFKQENLHDLPSESLDPYEERTVRVDKKAMIQFDCNRYPVAPEYAEMQLIVRATHATIKVLSENKTLHIYPRLWTKNETFIVPDHQQEIARTRGIKKHRVARSALETTLSCGHELVLRWAELDESLQSSARRVLDLVEKYGKESVETAAKLAIDNGTPRACSIAQILAECTSAPSAPIHIKTENNLPDLDIEWPSVSSYDELY
jgi:transposase